MRRQNGSIQSANLPTYGSLRKNEVAKDFGIYRCMVTEVFFTNDQNNTTFVNKQVTYEAIILGGRKEGQIITNIRNTNQLGGQYNYHERIFRKTFRPFSGQNSQDLPEQKGDIIYVSFIDGDTSLPIIIGCGTHPLDVDTTGATKEDGMLFRQEYNGIFQSINKDGEFELIRKGGTYNAEGQYFVPADRAEEEENGKAAEEKFQFKMQFLKGKAVWEDPNNIMTIDKEGKKWSLTVDKENAAVTAFADGSSETFDVRTKTGAALKISKDKVGLGTSSAELVTEFSNTLQELIGHLQDLQTETHTGNLGYPTGTPINAGSYAATAASLEAIKALIDSIKGGV